MSRRRLSWIPLLLSLAVVRPHRRQHRPWHLLRWLRLLRLRRLLWLLRLRHRWKLLRKRMPDPTISLGGGKSANMGASTATTSSPTATAAVNSVQNRRKIVAAMNALQVMLGSWKGTTNKEFGEFKALEIQTGSGTFAASPGSPHWCSNRRRVSTSPKGG